LAQKFGSQCVVAIDAKQIDGRWIVHLVGELNLFDWAKEVEQREGREILFTSMDMTERRTDLQMKRCQNFRVWSIFYNRFWRCW
jgi:imidazole glycerol phosphate synthase subunit HisF